MVEVHAQRSGFVTRCNARLIGEVIRDLGGGRITKDTKLNLEVGVDRLVAVGQSVNAGDLLGRIHAATDDGAARALPRVAESFTLSDTPPPEGSGRIVSG